jgi:hypothetical protein
MVAVFWRNLYSFSSSFKFSASGVRICPLYVSEFIILKKKLVPIIVSVTAHCTPCQAYGYDACAGEVWTVGGFILALFQGWGVGSEVLLEQVQLNFSFQNKFIILLPCGFLVDNNTFSKMCVFESLTGYTDYGGYVVKRNSAYTHIRVNDHIVYGRSVFFHG